MKEMSYVFSSENGQVTLTSREAIPQANSWKRFIFNTVLSDTGDLAGCHRHRGGC